jgi:hypothetical protein
VTEQRDAYFVTTDDGLQPAPQARSPWAADMLHGRLLAGLAAREVERGGHDPALRIVRLTVDMFRTPPMTPLRVASTVVRDGRRVRVVNVSIAAGDVEVARGVALLLRAGAHPDGAVWRAPEWDVAHPETLPPPEGDVGEWDIRMVSHGGFWSAARKQVWTRDRWQLVAGEDLSPVVRAALASDLPNPLANSSAEGLRFINADLTLFLARPPQSEWIGLEVASHVGSDGIALGACTLYDTAGSIGASTVCALTNTAALGS